MVSAVALEWLRLNGGHSAVSVSEKVEMTLSADAQS